MLLNMAFCSTLVLSACAVDPQSGRSKLDIDEVSATVIQSFPLAQKNGVLRRTAQGRYQLKLYDRNGVVNLPAEVSGFLISHASVRPDGSTVLVLNAPRPQCTGHSYIYLLRASTTESRVIETNQCGPLDFSAEGGQSQWVAQAMQPIPNGLQWIAQDGQLFSAPDPRSPAAARMPAGPVQPTAGLNRQGELGWHIEHGGLAKPPSPQASNTSSNNGSLTKTPPPPTAPGNSGSNNRFPVPSKASEPIGLPQAQAVVVDIKK